MGLMICEICNREIPDDPFYSDAHHLIPKSKKGKDVITIHRVCHNKIHSVWTEKELADYYNTPERILSHIEMQKFVNWMRNKPIDFYIKTKDSNVRKQKRRRR
jgi:hypothetical protein